MQMMGIIGSGEAELDDELGEEPADPLAMHLVDPPIIPPVGPLADALISVGIGDDYERIGVDDDGDWEQSIPGYTLDKTESGPTSSFGDSDQVETFESYHNVPPSSDGSMFEGINEYDCEYMEIDKEAPQIAAGATFKNVEEFRLCLRMHAMSKGIEFIFLKNDLLRVTIKCAMHECPWRVHASCLQDGVTFQIKTLHDEQTCINVKKVGSKMASLAWICEKILDYVKSNIKKSIPDFQMELHRQYNINVPYARVWTAREMAYERIYGKIELSYKQVPDLHNQLLKLNPGSIVHYQISPNKCFERFFVCFAACSTGFLVGCRPVIGVDGCLLKGRYKGTLLSASSIDGNHGLFPIAYAVCEGESGDTWTWFLECLREAI